MDYDLENACLLVSDSWGIYIPQRFAMSDFRATGANAQDLAILLEGPDSEHYWEAWDSVLDSVTLVEQDGSRWTLHQDGDLWAIREAV